MVGQSEPDRLNVVAATPARQDGVAAAAVFVEPPRAHLVGARVDHWHDRRGLPLDRRGPLLAI
eukprot:4840329-Heterocapsa_arctica.AAC.1